MSSDFITYSFISSSKYLIPALGAGYNTFFGEL